MSIPYHRTSGFMPKDGARGQNLVHLYFLLFKCKIFLSSYQDNRSLRDVVVQPLPRKLGIEGLIPGFSNL